MTELERERELRQAYEGAAADLAQANVAEMTALRKVCAIQAAELDRLRAELERAHEELGQGWPKLARDANRSAIEQWNRADAAEAEVDRLRDEREKALELLAFESTTDLPYAIEKRARQNEKDRAGLAELRKPYQELLDDH